MKDYIDKKISPIVSGDGGWVEYVALAEDVLTLSFRAECSKCIVLHRCCDWIRSEIKKELGKEVTIQAIINKPYFWAS